MTRTRYRLATGGAVVTGLLALAVVVSGVMSAHWLSAAEGALYIIVAVLLGLRTRHIWNRRYA
jgi:hypothetical protein